VILLTAGYIGAILDQPEYAGEFVDSIRGARSPYEDILHRDLLLAAACLADRTPVDVRCQQGVFDALCDALIAPTTAGQARAPLSLALERSSGIRVGAPRLQRLLIMAKHDDEEVRRTAVLLLSEVEAPGAHEAVRTALRDRCQGVVLTAAAALAAKGSMTKDVLSALCQRARVSEGVWDASRTCGCPWLKIAAISSSACRSASAWSGPSG
jgi:hypothetical protein